MADGAWDEEPTEVAYSMAHPMLYDGKFSLTLYGTHDQPMAPTVLLGIGRLRTSRSDGGPGPDLSDTTEQERLDTGGHTVVCGKKADGLLRCFVTVGSTIVRSHSRGVAFADIARSER